MSQQASEIVTLVVRHRVQPEMDQRYEAWLHRIVKTASQANGHLGVNVIRSKSQGLPLFISVLRFSHTQHMQAWLDSSERRELVAEVEHLLANGDQTEVSTDQEFWFMPNDGEKRPPRWKQACVTFLVILPLSLLVPLLWQPLFGWQPALGGYLSRGVLITLTIVLLVVYVFMPLATRLFANWLNGPQSEEAI